VFKSKAEAEVVIKSYHDKLLFGKPVFLKLIEGGGFSVYALSN